MLELEEKVGKNIDWPTPHSKVFELKTQFLVYHPIIIAETMSKSGVKFELVVRMMKTYL